MSLWNVSSVLDGATDKGRQGGDNNGEISPPSSPSPTKLGRKISKGLDSSGGAHRRESLMQLKRSISRRTLPLLEHLTATAQTVSQKSLSSLSSSSFRKRMGVKELGHDDVEIGDLIGQGGFSHVYELKNVRRASFMPKAEDFAGVGFDSDDGSRDCGGDEVDAIAEANGAAMSSEAPKKFVVKRLRTSLGTADRDRFHLAAADLALEARILSSLSHPNIIRLRGVTQGCEATALFAERAERAEDDGAEGVNEEDMGGRLDSDNLGGYFLVLDKLECTLEEKLEEWRMEKKALSALIWRSKKMWAGFLSDLSSSLSSSIRSGLDSSCHNGRPAGRKEMKRELLLRRLDISRQIARAMKYMHSRCILYRDLKPGNVGFDITGGQVKIFDFGLARFIPKEADERFRPTGHTGTLQYMAPEVAKSKPYGLPADVYSYGMILWEVLALEKPFGKITMKEFLEKVTYGDKRPKVKSARWPMEVCKLMTQCWAADARDRPQFMELLAVLDRELESFP